MPFYTPLSEKKLLKCIFSTILDGWKLYSRQTWQYQISIPQQDQLGQARGRVTLTRTAGEHREVHINHINGMCQQ